MVLVQLDIHTPLCPSNKLKYLYLVLYTKNNSKWIKDLNKKAKTIKVLDENKERNLCGLGLGKDFLALTKETQSHKWGGKKFDKLLFK